MDELDPMLQDEPVPGDTPVVWDESGDDLPDVGDDGASGEDDPIWADGEDGSSGDDGSYFDDEGSGDDELTGGDGSGEDWLGDDEDWLGDDEDWLGDDEDWLGDDEDWYAEGEFPPYEDWGCGMIKIDWEIVLTDDFIFVDDTGEVIETGDEVPEGETGEATAAVIDPAICVLFPCDSIL